MLKDIFICIFFIFGSSFAQVDDVNEKIEEIKEDLDDIDAVVMRKNEQIKQLQNALIQAEMLGAETENQLENLTEVAQQNAELEQNIVTLTEVIENRNSDLVELEAGHW